MRCIDFFLVGELIATANTSIPKNHAPLLPEWAATVSNMEKAVLWEIMVNNMPNSIPSIAASTANAHDLFNRINALKANTSALSTSSATKNITAKSANDNNNNADNSGIKRTEGGKNKGKGKTSDAPAPASKPATVYTFTIVSPNITTEVRQICATNLYKKSLLSTWLLDLMFQNWGTSIETADLRKAQLGDYIIGSLEKFTSLTRINLSNNPYVNDAMLLRFPTMERLTHLVLSRTEITDEATSPMLRYALVFLCNRFVMGY